jgi:uncharacterized repeat protein (TIGR01451 family)
MRQRPKKARSTLGVERLEDRTLLSAFFTVPYNGTLFLKPLGGDGGAVTEFGLGNSQTNHTPYLAGLPSNPQPNTQVQVGPVSAGASLDFYQKTEFGGTYWAFSNADDQASVMAFTDPDKSFSPTGSAVVQTGPHTWELHLDDAASYLLDDDDNDVIIEVHIEPAGPDLNVTQAAKPKAARPGAKVIFTISLVNTGSTPASGVVLTYQIPTGLVRIAGGGWNKITPRRFTLNVGNLGVDESLTLVFKARVAAGARPGIHLKTIVTADLDSLNGPDANLADNVHKISVRVL